MTPPKTLLEEMAEMHATEVAGGPLRDQAWHYVRRDFLIGAHTALELAAQRTDRLSVIVQDTVCKSPVTNAMAKAYKISAQKVRALATAPAKGEK